MYQNQSDKIPQIKFTSNLNFKDVISGGFHSL